MDSIFAALDPVTAFGSGGLVSVLAVAVAVMIALVFAVRTARRIVALGLNRQTAVRTAEDLAAAAIAGVLLLRAPQLLSDFFASTKAAVQNDIPGYTTAFFVSTAVLAAAYALWLLFTLLLAIVERKRSSTASGHATTDSPKAV
jgi:hypothetical protein